ncbi:MAG: glycosyltransferase family protein [Desulfobacterales bacterium]
MKILFGVQATGNGHISRSREVIARLRSRGHDIQVLFSGRDPSGLKETEVFEPFEVRRGLTFKTSRGRLQALKTAFSLNLPLFYRDILDYDASGVDVVITDYEPISARIARRLRIPSIGIGHQYAFCFDIPLTGANPLTHWLLRAFAPADHPIGLHWHTFGQPILPPIIPEHLDGNRPVAADKVLVYLPFEHPSEVQALLAPLTTHQFYIYGIADLPAPIDKGHLHLRPYSRRGFLRDLEDCNGVISNAGFELMGEALQIGKKLLVKPLKGQMEQLSNALALEKLRLATAMSSLDRKTVRRWLELPPNEPAGYPDVAQLIAVWIEKGRWEDIDGLSREAWARTKRVPLWDGR